MDYTKGKATYKVRLLRDKKVRHIKFDTGRIVDVTVNNGGSVFVFGYPSLVLDDSDYEMYVEEKDYWRLLLESEL